MPFHPAKMFTSAGGKLFLPAGARSKIFVPKKCETCQIGAPNLIPSPIDWTGAGWNTDVGVTVTPNFAESPGCGNDSNRIDISNNNDYAWWEGSGFTPSALLDVQVWMKVNWINDPTRSNFRIRNYYTNSGGRWALQLADPNLVGWQLLTPSHPAITVIDPFIVEPTGRISIGFKNNSAGMASEIEAWCIVCSYQ